MPPTIYLYLSTSVLLLAMEVEGLQITDLRVPHAVRNGSDSAILDCEYALLPEDLNINSGLVVKWFFNHSPFPVYQWIPGKPPQDLGVLKGQLDLTYRATDHNASMYRALYIQHPTTQLSGDYKCHVSTFRQEDFMIKKMLVFAPERSMVMMTHSRPGVDGINITCSASGVYPEPQMALYKDPDRIHKHKIEDAVVQKVSRNGAYDIKVTAVIENLENFVTPTIFDCKLWIPLANYTSKKSSVFYPGIMGFLSEENRCGTCRQVSSYPQFVLVAVTCALLSR